MILAKYADAERMSRELYMRHYKSYNEVLLEQIRFWISMESTCRDKHLNKLFFEQCESYYFKLTDTPIPKLKSLQEILTSLEKKIL